MFGQAQHATTNGLINSLAERRSPIIVSHAGVAVGSVAPNTALAVRAALASGADMVKLDVAASTDNVFFAFHDGFEEQLLGLPRNIQSLWASEVAELSYRWLDRPGRRARVERLEAVLGEFGGEPVVFALDRSWWRWPTLLKVLDGLGMPGQVVLKVPAWEGEALARLRAHRTKYAVLPICATLADVYEVVDDPDVNVVGVELIAHHPEDPWFSEVVLDEIHAHEVLVWVNSETLTTGIPLFGGLDDELALTHGPDASWKRMCSLGVDAIQTEWPWLLRSFRDHGGWD